MAQLFGPPEKAFQRGERQSRIVSNDLLFCKCLDLRACCASLYLVQQSGAYLPPSRGLSLPLRNDPTIASPIALQTSAREARICHVRGGVRVRNLLANLKKPCAISTTPLRSGSTDFKSPQCLGGIHPPFSQSCRCEDVAGGVHHSLDDAASVWRHWRPRDDFLPAPSINSG